MTIDAVSLAINIAKKNAANQLILDMGDTSTIGGGPAGGGGPLITAFVMEDFSYALGNRWEELWGTLMGAGTSMVQNTQQFLSSSFGIGWGTAQLRMENVNQTIYQWGGSERVTFTLPLVFVATSPQEDVLSPIMALNRMALGNFTPGNLQIAMRAPRGYRGEAVRCVGGLGIKYGRWFATPRIFLVKKFAPAMSKLTMVGSDGNQRPVIAAALLDIEAYRLVSGQEFNSWFVSEANTSGNALNPTVPKSSSFYNPNNYDPIAGQL